jgi:mono/diheme cytochrome c family protein
VGFFILPEVNVLALVNADEEKKCYIKNCSTSSTSVLKHTVSEKQPTLAVAGWAPKRWAIAFALVIVLMVVLLSGLYYWQHSDPYVQAVLERQGNVVRGNAIFQMNCAGCHGTLANGKVGPSLRGVASRRSQIGLIQQVISGKTPPMPTFQAEPAEMADLLSYLKTL